MRQDALNEHLRLPLSPRAIVTAIGLLAAGLAVLSVAAVVYKFKIDPGPHRTLMRIANLDGEGGLQAWYQGSTLLFCGVLFLLIALARRRAGLSYVRHWAFLGVAFAYLSADEASQLHEQTISPLHHALGTSGALYFAWVLPAMLILVVMGASYLRFLIDLPSRTRRLMLIAGCIYVGGALGFELLGGIYIDHYGHNTLGYALLANVEEVLEMTGVLILIWTLSSVIAGAEAPAPSRASDEQVLGRPLIGAR